MKATKWIGIGSPVMIGFTMAALARSAPTGAYKILETRLGPMDAEDPSSIVVSHDGSHVAYLTGCHRGACVVVRPCPARKEDDVLPR